jgi:hypothetical protein
MNLPCSPVPTPGFGFVLAMFWLKSRKLTGRLLSDDHGNRVSWMFVSWDGACELLRCVTGNACHTSTKFQTDLTHRSRAGDTWSPVSHEDIRPPKMYNTVQSTAVCSAPRTAGRGMHSIVYLRRSDIDMWNGASSRGVQLGPRIRALIFTWSP